MGEAAYQLRRQGAYQIIEFFQLLGDAKTKELSFDESEPCFISAGLTGGILIDTAAIFSLDYSCFCLPKKRGK